MDGTTVTKGKRKKIDARRWVAHLFWDFDDDAFYVRTSCGNGMCLNPNHIVVTQEHYKQNDA